MPRRPISFTQGFRESTSPFRVRRHGVAFPAKFPEEAAEEAGAAQLVASLSTEYGFRSDYPLRGELDAVAAMYLDAKRRRFPTAKEQRERLRGIEAAARAEDRERLDGLLAATNLGTLLADLEGAPFDVVLAHVEKLRPSLARPRPPVSGDRSLRIVVRELGLIWRDGTGRAPTITIDPTTEPVTRTGPFLAFMRRVVEFIGIRTSATALAKLHDRWKQSPKG